MSEYVDEIEDEEEEEVEVLKVQYFKCDFCSEFHLISKINIRLAQFSYLTNDSHREHVTYRHHVQVCDKCIDKHEERVMFRGFGF